MQVKAWFVTMWFITAGIAGAQTPVAPPNQESGRSMVEALAQFRFDQLGHPQIQSDSIKPVRAPADRPHRLLIVPVRFADTGYDRFAGDPAQDDRNRTYFQELLFAGGPENPAPGTLSHYYRHQSRGHIQRPQQRLHRAFPALEQVQDRAPGRTGAKAGQAGQGLRQRLDFW